MGFSKTQRLTILLVVDGIFCIIELGTGYAFHSLALVADAFHMLNDVLSLAVGLWAVKRAKTGRTKNYTYGWQRAETLGALVNGVFLVALCLSIFLEAIQRFFEPQVVTNPKMVLVVGCIGLLFNILGLALFHDHDHGHSHEGGGDAHSESHGTAEGAAKQHSHGTKQGVWSSIQSLFTFGGKHNDSHKQNSARSSRQEHGHNTKRSAWSYIRRLFSFGSSDNNQVKRAEEGHTDNAEPRRRADETTRLLSDHEVENVTPPQRVVKRVGEGDAHNITQRHNPDETTALLIDYDNDENTSPSKTATGSKRITNAKESRRSDESSNTTQISDITNSYRRQSASAAAEQHRRRPSFLPGSIDDMPVLPASRRDMFINAPQLDIDEHSDTHTEEGIETDDESPTKTNPDGKTDGYDSIQPHDKPKDTHAAHKHRKPKEQQPGGGGHGHSHGDLNMRGVFLHVLGDALGNVGVIASALIIWLTKFPQRYYADPAISLIITIIILKTAIPLCRAASRILLQAVPVGMQIDEIRADIEDLEGVTSAHHIHVWELSNNRFVASLHVRIAPEIKNPGSEGYMRLAREIQKCLQEWGIRSSTIQPEFECALETIEEEAASSSAGSSTCRSSKHNITNVKNGSTPGNLLDDGECMLDSEDAGAIVEQQESHHTHEHNQNHSNSHDDHDHEHDDGHGHSSGKNKHSQQH